MTTIVAVRELRPTPGIATSFRQQVRLLGLSGRWLYLTLGLLGALLFFGVAMEGVRPGLILLLALLIVPAGSIWALMVWGGERPSRRSYHWSLPVPRPPHDLARVLVGAAYLVGICAVLAAASAAVDWLNGVFTLVPDELTAFIYGARAWPYYFAPPLILYFLTMPLVLWSDYPITRWMLWFWVGFSFVGVLLSSRGFHLVDGWLEAVFAGKWGLSDAVLTGVLRGETFGDPAATQYWWGATMVWFALGLVLTAFTAIYRPDDLKRLARLAG